TRARTLVVRSTGARTVTSTSERFKSGRRSRTLCATAALLFGSRPDAVGHNDAQSNADERDGSLYGHCRSGRCYGMMMFRLMPVLLASLLAVGCGWIGDHDRFKLVHVDDVKAMLDARNTPVTLVDANGTDFREREGVIPGAVLLTSYSKYDVAK